MSASDPRRDLPETDDNFSDSGSSTSDELDITKDEGWEDVEPDDDSQPIVGLFSADVYPDVRSMLKETKEKYNFDLRRIQKELGV